MYTFAPDIHVSLRIARPYLAYLRLSRVWYTLPPHSQLPRAFTTLRPLRANSDSDKSKIRSHGASKRRQDDPKSQEACENDETRPLRDNANSDEPKVRWYEQLFPWSSKRRRVDPNKQDAYENDEVKRLRRQISQLEGELHDMEAPVAETGKTLIEPLLATLSPEDQQNVRDAIMQDEAEEKQKELNAAEVKQSLANLAPKKSELEISLELPPEQGAYLRALNTNIQKAAGKLLDQDLRRKLWVSYVRCKAILPPFLHLIPEKAWSVLWASHLTMSMDYPQWASRILTLSEDVVSAGKELNIYQRFSYIEALRLDGRQDEAISQWQKLKGDLGDDKQAMEGYELLGVSLFASNGDPVSAEKLALSYLRPETSGDPRILIPIISAWAQRGDSTSMKHAWALYLRFKAQVGDNITMKDYDNITMSLLHSGRGDLALAVFKDLMLTGERTGQGSMELYRKAASLIGKSQSSAITPEDLNGVSLTALTILPRRFQNKFFYASWLRKLLGMGEVNAASMVIDLMYERGIKPDAKHLNGLIAVWLQSGNHRDQDRAEQMAWAMIHERLVLVNRRRRGDDLNASDMPLVQRDTVTPHLRRAVSPATIGTFSLLLQYYGRRSMDVYIQRIQELLAKAEIPPDSYFINHLLWVDLHKGQRRSVWERYQRMFHKTQPDLETFFCLWKCEKAHLHSLLFGVKDEFPGPRRIMSDMMNWYSSLRPTERKSVREDFSKELHNLIIWCFGRATDLEGMIAALYGMRETFGLYPDEETAQTVNFQIYRMGIGENEKPRPGGRRAKNPQRKRSAARIAKAFAAITEQRERYLVDAGLNDFQQCDARIQREEGLFILAEFLRAFLRRTSVDEGAVEGNIEKAAWEMGVSGVRMDDPLPSYDVYTNRTSMAKELRHEE